MCINIAKIRIALLNKRIAGLESDILFEKGQSQLVGDGHSIEKMEEKLKKLETKRNDLMWHLDDPADS